MVNETDIQEGHFAESPRLDDGQSSETLLARIAELEQEKADLQSRLGSQIQKSGEELASREKEYADWANRVSAYYEENDARLRERVKSLEDRLLDLDSESARMFIQEQRDSESKMMEKRKQDHARQQAQMGELVNAKGEAMKTFSGVTEADLAGATSVSQVWAMAGARAQQLAIEAVKSQLVETRSPEPEPEPQTTVSGPPQQARVPAPTRGSTQPHRASGHERQMDELRAALDEAKRKGQLVRVAQIRGQMVTLERENS